MLMPHVATWQKSTFKIEICVLHAKAGMERGRDLQSKLCKYKRSNFIKNRNGQVAIGESFISNGRWIRSISISLLAVCVPVVFAAIRSFAFDAYLYFTLMSNTSSTTTTTTIRHYALPWKTTVAAEHTLTLKTKYSTFNAFPRWMPGIPHSTFIHNTFFTFDIYVLDDMAMVYFVFCLPVHPIPSIFHSLPLCASVSVIRARCTRSRSRITIYFIYYIVLCLNNIIAHYAAFVSNVSWP